MKQKRWFTFIVIFQVLVLVFMAGSFYAIDVVGKEITLETEPVDPRDLFYGDYVILRYDIQTLDQGLWKEETEPEPGQTVYVKLEPSGEHYAAAGIYAKRPKASGDAVILQARYRYDRHFANEYYLEYGLERYYIPEDTGKEIEEQREGMTVDLLVAPWGQAKIKRLNLQESDN